MSRNISQKIIFSLVKHLNMYYNKNTGLSAVEPITLKLKCIFLSLQLIAQGLLSIAPTFKLLSNHSAISRLYISNLNNTLAVLS